MKMLGRMLLAFVTGFWVTARLIRRRWWRS